MPSAPRSALRPAPPPNMVIQSAIPEARNEACSANRTNVLRRAASCRSGMCQSHTTANSISDATKGDPPPGHRFNGSHAPPDIPSASSGAAKATTAICAVMWAENVCWGASHAAESSTSPRRKLRGRVISSFGRIAGLNRHRQWRWRSIRKEERSPRQGIGGDPRECLCRKEVLRLPACIFASRSAR